MELREYQKESIESVFNYFSENSGNPIIAIPTGAGKSLIIAGFLQRVYASYPNERIIMITHTKEIIKQNYEKLITLWPGAPAGIYSAGLNKKHSHNKITFAGIASVYRKPELFGHVNLILVDEAHRWPQGVKNSYYKFYQKLKEINPKIKVIGLTATAWRMKSGQITEGHVFTDICYDLTSTVNFNKLIADGYLSPLIAKQTNEQLDVSNVRVVGGEFVEKDLQQAVDKSDVTLRALTEALSYSHGRKAWLVFTTGIDHCEHVSECLSNLGVSCTFVHSRMSNKLRDSRLEDFTNGKYKALVNVGVLTTGFDHPGIDLIIMLRPTMSSALWVQILGRGLRISPGKKNCLVLDYAGNTLRLGPINDPVKGKVKKGDGTPPVKMCTSCRTLCHISVKVCETCGAEFEIQINEDEKIDTRASNLKLIKSNEDLEPEKIIKYLKVDTVSYSLHKKRADPSRESLKVSYYCGLNHFADYFQFNPEDSHFVKLRSNKWVNEVVPKMAIMLAPKDGTRKINYLLKNSVSFKKATRIKVEFSKDSKYPKVKQVFYDECEINEANVNHPVTMFDSRLEI